jgi:2-keto-4-pentenoate hydratase/2-oxohepta-3-ene-1,7-dioic acid hydratase in catechol pathway
MEINSSGEADAKAQGKEFKPSWLAPGDEIELQITGLGSLKNKIVRSSSDFSIFAKKKNV